MDGKSESIERGALKSTPASPSVDTALQNQSISIHQCNTITSLMRSYIPDTVKDSFAAYHIPIPENDVMLAIYVFAAAFTIRIVFSRFFMLFLVSCVSFLIGLLWTDWRADSTVSGLERIRKYGVRSLNAGLDSDPEAQRFLEEQAATKERMMLLPSKALEPRLTKLVGLIVDKFVLNWYMNLNKSKNPEFPDAVRVSLTSAFVQLGIILNRCHPTDFLLSVIECFVNHVKQFRELERSGLSLQEFAEQFPRSSLITGIKDEDVCEGLRNISMRLAIRLLPKADRSSPVVFALVREILATSVLLPVVQRFSDPVWINQRLATGLKKTPKEGDDLKHEKSLAKSNVKASAVSTMHREPSVEFFVKVLEGQSLPIVPATGYLCIVSCGPHVLRTRKVVRDSNPIWNEDLHLLIAKSDAIKFKVLHIRLVAVKSLSEDIIASLELPIEKIEPNKFLKERYEMTMNPNLTGLESSPTISLEIIYVNTEIVASTHASLMPVHDDMPVPDTSFADLTSVLISPYGLDVFTTFLEIQGVSSLTAYCRLLTAINSFEEESDNYGSFQERAQDVLTSFFSDADGAVYLDFGNRGMTEEFLMSLKTDFGTTVHKHSFQPLKERVISFLSSQVGQLFLSSPEYRALNEELADQKLALDYVVESDADIPGQHSGYLETDGVVVTTDEVSSFRGSVDESIDDMNESSEMSLTVPQEPTDLGTCINIPSGSFRVKAIESAITQVQVNLEDIVSQMASADPSLIESLVESKVGYQTELSRLRDWLEEETASQQDSMPKNAHVVQDEVVCCVLELQEHFESQNMTRSFSASLMSLGDKSRSAIRSNQSSPSRLRTRLSRSPSPDSKAKRRSYGGITSAFPNLIGVSGSNLESKQNSFSLLIRVEEKHTNRGWVVTKTISELQEFHNWILEEFPRSRHFQFPAWTFDNGSIMSRNEEEQDAWKLQVNEWLAALLADSVIAVSPHVFSFFSIISQKHGSSFPDSLESSSKSQSVKGKPLKNSAALMFDAFKSAGTAFKKVAEVTSTNVTSMADTFAQTASEGVNALASGGGSVAVAGAATLKRFSSISNIQTIESTPSGNLADEKKHPKQEYEEGKESIDEKPEKVPEKIENVPSNIQTHPASLPDEPDSPAKLHRISEADLATLLDYLFAAIEELFHLTAPNQWMKQQSLNIVKVVLQKTYSQKLSKLLRDKVEDVATEETVGKLLETITNAIGPGSIRSEPAAVTQHNGTATTSHPQTRPSSHLSDELPAVTDPLAGLSNDDTRMQAKLLLVTGQGSILESSLDTLARVLGRSTITVGLTRVFQMLQQQELNRALILALLDAIMETLSVS